MYRIRAHKKTNFHRFQFHPMQLEFGCLIPSSTLVGVEDPSRPSNPDRPVRRRPFHRRYQDSFCSHLLHITFSHHFRRRSCYRGNGCPSGSRRSRYRSLSGTVIPSYFWLLSVVLFCFPDPVFKAVSERTNR
jgi:hypothetical protein